MARYNLKDLNKALAALDKNEINPVIGTTCVYDDHNGKCCIVGQILVNWNLVLPKKNASPFASVSYSYVGDITDAARWALTRLQGIADGVNEANRKPAPLPWGEAIKKWRRNATRT